MKICTTKTISSSSGKQIFHNQHVIVVRKFFDKIIWVPRHLIHDVEDSLQAATHYQGTYIKNKNESPGISYQLKVIYHVRRYC